MSVRDCNAYSTFRSTRKRREQMRVKTRKDLQSQGLNLPTRAIQSPCHSESRSPLIILTPLLLILLRVSCVRKKKKQCQLGHRCRQPLIPKLGSLTSKCYSTRRHASCMRHWLKVPTMEADMETLSSILKLCWTVEHIQVRRYDMETLSSILKLYWTVEHIQVYHTAVPWPPIS
uniref:Uncharacterized protein n=1 Tax=Cacopsylla melanoneura TaxID=428564 RepID=A0A8D8W6W2_9HEMI